MSNFVWEDSEVKKVFEKLMEDKNKELRFSATKGLFRMQNSFSNSEREKLFKDIKNRYKLMSVLSEIGETDLIPELYRTRQEVAEAELYYGLTNDESDDNEYYYYGSGTPVKMKLIKEKNTKINGNKMTFYVFSYYEQGYDREKKIGVATPLPKDSLKFYDEVKVRRADYSSQSEGKQAKILIKEWEDYYSYYMSPMTYDSVSYDDVAAVDSAVAIDWTMGTSYEEDSKKSKRKKKKKSEEFEYNWDAYNYEDYDYYDYYEKDDIK
jgi:hypothetical protein